MDLKALVAKARQDFDSVEPVEQDVVLAGELVTVRVWPLTGPQWRDLCAKHPNRTDSAFDQALGYNLTAVLADYPRVYLVNGNDVVDAAEDWADICAVLSGPDLKNLELAVWGVNEYDPAQRLVAAGKASAGGRKKKRS